jgi:hypothetical protein
VNKPVCTVFIPVLLQVRGVKRVLLWPPHCAGALYTDPEGSSSPVTRLEDPDLRQYPRYVMKGRGLVVHGLRCVQ